MTFSGRRLKRYLLLKRKSLNLIGGIELVTPDSITGWAVAKDFKLDEIRLYIGSYCVAKAPINIRREDVCKKYNLHLSPGFEIKIPEDIDKENINQKIKLEVINYQAKKSFNISSIVKDLNIEESIKKILKMDLVGVQGHFDGVIDNKLKGWISQKNRKKVFYVWMQCKGNIPIEVKCNKSRTDINIEDMRVNSGFEFDLNDLPNNWLGKEVFFSFDKSGELKLNQLSKVITNKVKPLVKTKDIISIDNQFNNLIEVPEDYSSHWDALEKFSDELRQIEIELNKNEYN